MWSAIRSDLTEFVSSVADDGTAVMTNIESKIIPESDAGSDYGSDDEQVIIGDDGDIVTQMNFERTGIVSNAQDEVCRREGLEETYTRPLLKGEVNGVKPTLKAEKPDDDKDATDATDEDGEKNEVTESTDSDVKEGETNNDEEEDEKSTIVSTIGQTIDRMTSAESEDEPALLEGDSDHEPNQEKVQAFLETFDLSSKTDAISTILSGNSTVQEYFQTLVPLVLTYEQFWQRYFYRCNAMRIQVKWDDLEAQKALERRERVKKGVENVQKLWGGALNAVKGVTSNVTNGTEKSEKKESILSKYQAELQQLGAQVGARSFDSNEQSGNDGSSMKLGLGIFGGPRYASDSEDEKADHEDGEEEYEDDEFGWGSEEEDDDEDDEDVSLDDPHNESEEITFTTPPIITQEELDELRSSLKQFQEEKEKLQERIELQGEELIHLKEDKASSRDSLAVVNGDKEEQHLKLLLFEKDAEIAALKASLEDSTREDHIEETNKQDEMLLSKTKEVEKMHSLLKIKEKEFKKANQDLTNAISLRDQSLQVNQDECKKALEEAQEITSKVQLELTEAKAKTLKCIDEAQEWKEQVSSLKQKFASETATRVSVEARLDEANGILQENEMKQELFETEIQKLKIALQGKDEELIQQKLSFEEKLKSEVEKVRQVQQTLSPPLTQDAEGGSFSSGIDVAQPESQEESNKLTQADSDDEEEVNGWGASWESDED